jgi:hypothetical protein
MDGAITGKRKWQKFTSLAAVRQVTGRTFAQHEKEVGDAR